MGNNQWKLQGALRFGNLSGDPTPTSAGLSYFSTSVNKLRLYNGSAWVSLANLSELASTTDGSAGADLVGGENKSYTNISGLTTYTVQDFIDRIDVALGVSGGSTFNDNVFRIYDNGDNTKQIAFQASGISTATTRTITMPDADVDLGNLTNSNISASAAIVYSKLNLTGSIVNADINASAAIAYSKLSLTNSIVNADINASAAIAYSKLNLANSIVNADIATGAAIDAAKIHDGSVSNTEFGYLDGVTSSIQTQLDAKADDADVIKKDGSVAFTGDQSMGGFKLTSLGAPTSGTDAATKQYVDNVAEGLKPKAAVRAATTADITLANEQTIDDVALVAGDRVLVKDQTDDEDNGIYNVVDAGAWTRSSDFDSLTPIDEVNGAYVAVQEGTVNAGKIYVQQGEVTAIGTDPIIFVFFNSSASLVGGDGITVSGNNISVDHDGEGLTFVATQLALELDGSTLSKSASGLKVADGGITNTQVNASAAIAYSKLNLSNSIVNADINASAAIAYSKLSLTNSIVNADINSAAAIAYSKLNLSASIVNADIAAAAAIALNKLAAVTANRALASDGSGFIVATSVTDTELGYLSGVTSAIQTQLDAKVTGPASATDEALARFDGTTGKLVQNSSTNLSDSGALTIADVFKRGDGGLTNFIEEEYIYNQSLTASTTAVLAALTFDSKVYKAIHVEYQVRNGNNRRTGKLYVVCDNADGVAATNVSIVDNSTETAEINLSWSAAMNGDNVEISYTTSSGTYSINMDTKRFKS